MKQCPVCGNEVRGRSDKIFCSNTCKAAQHYEIKQQNERFYLEVDRQLKLNRRILKKNNRTGYTTLRREVLLKEGFNPKFFTHYWKNSKGQLYLFCYDFGFLELNQQGVKKYILVEWQPYMAK